MPALLEIDQYFVDEFSLEVNPEYSGEKCQHDLGIDFEIGRASDGQPSFEVRLIVDLNKGKKAYAKSPYRIHVVVTGYFHFPNGSTEERINNLIGPNGLSILYGIARSTVSQMVGLGRYGRVLLPSVNFIEVIKDKGKREKVAQAKLNKITQKQH